MLIILPANADFASHIIQDIQVKLTPTPITPSYHGRSDSKESSILRGTLDNNSHGVNRSWTANSEWWSPESRQINKGMYDMVIHLSQLLCSGGTSYI
jgi:hypothetical protein